MLLFCKLYTNVRSQWRRAGVRLLIGRILVCPRFTKLFHFSYFSLFFFKENFLSIALLLKREGKKARRWKRYKSSCIHISVRKSEFKGPHLKYKKYFLKKKVTKLEKMVKKFNRILRTTHLKLIESSTNSQKDKLGHFSTEQNRTLIIIYWPKLQIIYHLNESIHYVKIM